ncbi:glycosyltransferase family 2 protein [Pengzhenrongella sp.]|uniref:glycosyltransferase family 2 protein n=1 Tax=Pengzhenrongella sp. TaxID=2888820 RepID=UPI002F94B43B
MTAVVPICVVVPTVLRPDALARCLDALLDGEVWPAAVLVIDQGGDEETAVVIATRAAAGLQVIHVRSALRGLSAARNTGLRQVSTPWVAFTDDDCVPSPTWLAAISRRAGAPDAPDGVSGRVLPLGEPAPGTYPLSLRVSTEPAVFAGRALPWEVGTGGNMALRVAAVRDVGGYDERLGSGTPGQAGEDLEIIHRLLRAGATLAFDPDVIVLHARVTAPRRLSTRRSYGFGMGAFVGIWVRSDRWVATTLLRWMVGRLVAAAKALKARDPRRLREEALLVAGALAGTRFGWRLGSPLASEPRPQAAAAGPSGDLGVDLGQL